MDHQVEAHIQGTSATEGKIGLNLSMAVKIVVPSSVGFGAPPPRSRELKIDDSKVNVRKG